MDDLRPHLLIPETEVEYVDPTPPRGPKKEDVDHFEHGKVLSSGLQEIIDAYTKVQSAGSLTKEDIRVFEVLLSDDEKFSNKALRDFLAGEGIKIKSVHDLLEHLIARFRELDSDADLIIQMRLDNPKISDRKIAEALGRPQRTFADQMKRYYTELHKEENK